MVSSDGSARKHYANMELKRREHGNEVFTEDVSLEIDFRV
jgi:hypothetical protein